MANPLVKAMLKAHIATYRLTSGKLGGSMKGTKVLLLTTTGRKSGQPRTMPLMDVPFEGKAHVIASAGGAPTDPAWFRNLDANPEVTVQQGSDTWTGTAEVLEGEERDAVYAAAEAVMDNFTGYAAKADREIPVVRLNRA